MSTASGRSVKLRVFTRYEGTRVWARVVPVGYRHAFLGGTIDLDLVFLRDGSVVRTERFPELGLSPLPERPFEAGDAPWGCCAFRARFTDRAGLPWPTEVLHDRLPEGAGWLGSGEGVSRVVPAPWTPMRVERRARAIEVQCWGRSYRFGATSLLEQATSQSRELLAAPLELVAVVGGRRVSWRGALPEPREEAPDRVVVTHTLTGGPGGRLTLDARWEIEFDGVAWVDCALHASRDIALDRLDLELRLVPSSARYLYTFPGQWGGASNAGAFTRRRYLPFRPYLWLGDEDVGLGWFAESDESWISHGSQREKQRVVELVPGRTGRGEPARVRMRLSAVPVTLRRVSDDGNELTGTGEAPKLGASGSRAILRYSFGIQATPVKPVERSAWDERIFCIGQKTPGFSPRLRVSAELLDTLARSGVRAVVIFEHWADAEGYVRTPHGEALRTIVRECHARGLRVLLYFGFLISDIAAEWPLLGKECLKLPKSGYPVFSYSPQPVQGAWIACLGSLWQDLLVDGIARAMEDFDLDGVYLDGTELPFACTNTEHGCGRVEADGSVAPSYPIGAVRGAMRRIFAAVRSRRPEGSINVHNSTCMTMPTLGWATSSWDGEQFQGVGKGVDVGSLLPLDTFRAEFMGRQWGVASEFLLAGEAYSFEQACAFSLLHDVPVRPNEPGKDLELMSIIWRAMDEFGRLEAEWLPYWRCRNLVAPLPVGVFVSLYRHRTNGLLAVVANLGSSQATANLLPKRSAGMRTSLDFRDALTGKLLVEAGSSVTLSILPLGWRLVRIVESDSSGRVQAKE